MRYILVAAAALLFAAPASAACRLANTTVDGQAAYPAEDGHTPFFTVEGTGDVHIERHGRVVQFRRACNQAEAQARWNEGMAELANNPVHAPVSATVEPYQHD